MLTLTEAAASLDLSPITLRLQVRNGKLRARKMGRDWFVTEREVERYRRENKRPSEYPEPLSCCGGIWNHRKDCKRAVQEQSAESVDARQ